MRVIPTISGLFIILSANLFTHGAIKRISTTSVKIAVLDPYTDPSGQVYVLNELLELPDIANIASTALHSNRIYTASNLTESDTGWSSQNLDFSLGLTGDSRNFPGVICTDCNKNQDFTLLITNLPKFGKCSGGWCKYGSSSCYYNLKDDFWYSCKPFQKPKSSRDSREKPLSRYYVSVYKNRIEITNLIKNTTSITYTTNNETLARKKQLKLSFDF